MQLHPNACTYRQQLVTTTQLHLPTCGVGDDLDSTSSKGYFKTLLI